MFSLGQVVATPAALEALPRNQQELLGFISRHVQGDWGDLDEGDKQENELSVKHGLRIVSAYHLRDKTKIWIITEADRSVTTVLLPEDY
jgi:hypothetical protein